MHADRIALTLPASQQRRAFSYVHVVTLEETSVVGSVYFARHIAWQGRCREMFLKEHAPQVAQDLAGDLRLVTLSVSCEYFEEVRPFDTVQILMSLRHIRQNRVALDFEYRRIANSAHPIVALSYQEFACMRSEDGRLATTSLPIALENALHAYRHD